MKKLIVLSIMLILIQINGMGQTSYGFLRTEQDTTRQLDKIGGEEDSKKPELGALPGVISPFTSARVIPSLRLRGSHFLTKHEGDSSGIFHDAEIFFAKEPALTLDSLTFSSTYEELARDLWIPEASSFFFKYSVSYIKKFYNTAILSGFNTGFTFLYMNKQIPGKVSPESESFDEVQTIGLGAFQINVRLFFSNKKGLTFSSIYANYNFQSGFDHISSYKEYFGLQNNSYHNFLDVGFEVALGNKEDSKGSNFFIDMGFIIQSDDIKAITNNNDRVIPMIKIKANPSF